MYPQLKYSKVESGDDSDSEAVLASSAQPHKRSTQTTIAVVLALLASNLATWFLSSGRTAVAMPRVALDYRTPYAGLARDTPLVIDTHDRYTDLNDTLRDELWLSINVDDGMIALPDTYSQAMGLPESQRFPWDHSKGIYLLQAHHNLHCARSIYISLMEYRQGVRQTRSHHHIIHCLDALRRDVICNADDIPRHTTPDPVPETGHGQYRQCRSWDKLNAWAQQHNACYRYIHETQRDFPEVQRFVWCPEGSPYRDEVSKYFTVDFDAPRGEGVV